MSTNLLYTIYLAGAFLILFTSAEILYHKFKINAELTRKYVHFSTGIITMLFPPLIQNHWLVLLLCGSFYLILIVTMSLKLLQSIHGVERTTRGSLLYPIIVYGCFLTYQYFDQLPLYYVPILILAISDPIAALVGKSFPLGKYKSFGKFKTLSGSSAFLVSAFLLCFFLLYGLNSLPLHKAIITALGVAFATSVAEALTHKGFDNLSIPASALVVLIFFNDYYYQI
jgi:phytol kinase